MLKMTKSRERKRIEHFELVFKIPDGKMYGFDCDEKGRVDKKALNPIARQNYEACVKTGIRGEIHVFYNEYIDPAEGVCPCGHTVVLYDSMTNVCEHCGRYYNGCGQELNPPSMWEEDY